MFVKQIIIQGFKSYKDQLVVEPFSPTTNVIAIRFVLSDAFGNIRAEDRRQLLHEGSGDAVMSAYVELIFDNTDGRLPIDREEVSLRRTIGLKKDEYYLDKKHVTKSDVISLLESAGFSRSNPYYIVQQGKINSLATMRDNERLELLKEVAGTRLYEERRSESLRVMEESRLKREKIEDVITYIEKRLGELEEEKEELKEYQGLDREKRALEFTIYEKELREVREKLEALEVTRSELHESASNQHSSAQGVADALREAEAEVSQLERAIESLRKDAVALREERSDMLQSKAQIELDVGDVEESLGSASTSQDRIRAELKEVDKQIKKAERELGKSSSAFGEALADEDRLADQVRSLEHELEAIYSKQGRGAQFKTKKERDVWLRKEISELEKHFASKQEQLAGLDSEISSLREDIAKRESVIESTEGQAKERRSLIDSTNDEYAKQKKQRDALSAARKELWDKESELEKALENGRAELESCSRQLQGTLPRDLHRGLAAVRRIAEEHRIAGVHGPLVELFECDADFNTCVEVTAGLSLFHIVVETDDVASELLEHLNRERAGRVTFIPLNRVAKREQTYPETEDAVPMISKLSFKGKFAGAMGSIFGKTLICRDLEVAAALAREHELNCITLDGDQVNRRGALTGGFYDARQSRLEAARGAARWREETATMEATLDEHRKSLRATDQQISAVLGEIQKLDAKRSYLRETIERLAVDLQALNRERQQKIAFVEQRERARTVLQNSVKDVETTIEARRAEVGTALKTDLTDADHRGIASLNERLAKAREGLVEAQRQRAIVEAEKKTLEGMLQANLLKRRDELVLRQDRLRGGASAADLDQLRSELAMLDKQVEELQQRAQDTERSLEEKSARLREVQTRAEDLRTQETEETRRGQDQAKTMEKLMNRRSLLLQKREDYTKKIQEIGSLPADAFERFGSRDVKHLMRALQKCNEKLKKYSNVNKKALDQYVNFSEQRDQLLKRKEEIDRGESSIASLVSHLDMRKDEAIERTFKGVAKHFQDVFRELVPNGKASLVMQRRADGEDEGSSGDKAGGRMLSYKGVSVKVSFTGRGEAQLMQQLSGGQKTVVALALIFAIQRCDPAPFYLFDEIDANLDAAYRTSVGSMIRHQAEEGAQFILTTFRPELIEASEQFYCVSYRNKLSNVDVVSREDALGIIAEEAHP